jgi:hypothetical protein
MKPEDRGTDSARGQQKLSTWTRVNPATGETETKQGTNQEWRERNKADGWTRPEDDTDATDEPAVT